jgi:two-component system sensor histidine kinase YesM
MGALILCSVFVPLTIALLLFNSYASETLSRQTRGSAEYSFSQLYDIFSSRFETVRQDMMLIQIDTNARLLLQKEMSETDILKLSQNKVFLNTTIDYIENKNYWDMSICVYLPDEKHMLYDDHRFLSASTVQNQTWYVNLVTKPYKNQWYYDSSLSGAKRKIAFSYLVRVCKPSNYAQTAAVIRVDFSMDKVLNSMIQSLPLIEGASVYLLTEEDEIVIQAGNGDISYPLPPRMSIARYSVIQKYNHEYEDNQYYVQEQRFKFNSWRLMMIMPMSESIQLLQSNQQWSTILLVALACGVCIFAFGILFSRQINRRISLVSIGMSNLKDGVLKPLPDPKVRDEIGILTESYNYLTGELNMLTAARSMADSNKKHAEMIALQAQINPHFLYNTLEMINYFAMMGDAEQVERIVLLLSRFYKRCLNQGEEYSTLSQELDLTQAYWSIQEIRYHGKISFQQNVPQELMNYHVPHIILQPIVENAIHHGLMTCEKQGGTITISGKKKDNLLILSIMDDGAGMSKERLSELSSGLALQYNMTEVGSHYGLRNINERLINLYGEEYGLSFRSVSGEGTTITITIPIQQE